MAAELSSGLALRHGKSEAICLRSR